MIWNISETPVVGFMNSGPLPSLAVISAPRKLWFSLQLQLSQSKGEVSFLGTAVHRMALCEKLGSFMNSCSTPALLRAEQRDIT